MQENTIKPKIELPDLKLQNSAKSDMLKSDLRDSIVYKVKQDYSNLQQMKLHPELIVIICSFVEQSINNNKKKKIDKKALVVDVFRQLYSLTPDEIMSLVYTIQYLFDNKKIQGKTWLKFASTAISVVTSFLKAL